MHDFIRTHCCIENTFIHDIVIPHSLHTYDAKELTQGKMKEKLRHYEIYNNQNEPYSPWQSLAENAVGEIKNKKLRFMREAYTPIRLIDYALKYTCELRNFSPSSVSGSTGRSPHEFVVENPDLS